MAKTKSIQKNKNTTWENFQNQISSSELIAKEAAFLVAALLDLERQPKNKMRQREVSESIPELQRVLDRLGYLEDYKRENGLIGIWG